jgi:hypothetical protein
MSGQGLAQPGQGWWHGITSSTLWAISAPTCVLDDASMMPTGMATSAIVMASTPRATKQRCSVLFTVREIATTDLRGQCTAWLGSSVL